MERRPVQLLIDIIPIKETLHVILEGGTITNIASSKQCLEIGSTPSNKVQVRFVQKKACKAEKNDLSDDEEDEEEELAPNSVKNVGSEQSALIQMLKSLSRKEDVAARNLSVEKSKSDPQPNRSVQTNTTNTCLPDGKKPRRVSKTDARSTVPGVKPVQNKFPVTPLINGDAERLSVPASPRFENNNVKIGPGSVKINRDDISSEEQQVESKKSNEKIENTDPKADEIQKEKPGPIVEGKNPDAKITPKRKRGRPFKKDGVKQSPKNASNKKAKTSDNMRTRSRSRHGEPCNKLPSPKEEDMSKFIKVEKVENSLPEFVCQLCGFRLDQERYVHKHVKLRHASEWNRAQQGKSDEQTPVKKEDVDKSATSGAQSHFTRNRRSRRSSLPDTQTEPENECNTPDNKRRSSATEPDSPGLSGTNDCSLCGQSFSSRQAFHHHIESVHHIPVDSQIPHYTCNTCQTEFVKLVTYENHMLNVHSSTHKFACSIEGCGAKLNTRAGLTRHTIRMHKDTGSPEKALASESSSKQESWTEEGDNSVGSPVKYQGIAADVKVEEDSNSNLENKAVERPKVSRPECKTCGKKFISVLNLQRHEESCVVDQGETPNSAITSSRNMSSKSPELIRDNNNTITKVPKTETESIKTPDVALKVPQLQLQDIALLPKMNALLSPVKCEEEPELKRLKVEGGYPFPQETDPHSNSLTHTPSSMPTNVPKLKPNISIAKSRPEKFTIYNSPSKPYDNVPPNIPPRESQANDVGYNPQIPVAVANSPGNILQKSPLLASALSKPSTAPVPAISQVAHPPPDSTTKTQRLQCSKCSLQFISVVNLQRHEKYAHKDEAEKCVYPDCTLSFGSPRMLKNHVDRVHKEKLQHACHQCHKSFGTITSLKSHIKTVHQKIKDIVCPWKDCGKTFGRSSHLDNHMKRHRGQMNFHCQYCPYRCIQRASLNYHMRHSHPNDHYCRESTKVKTPPSTEASPSTSPGPMSPGPVTPGPPETTTASHTPVSFHSSVMMSPELRPTVLVSNNNVSFDQM